MFNSTNEAIAFGLKMKQEDVAGLEDQRQGFLRLYEKEFELAKETNQSEHWNKCSYWATKAQFCREAIEVFQKGEI